MAQYKLSLFQVLFVFFFLSLFIPQKLEAGPYAPSLQWKTTQTEHFSIHYYEGEEKIAAELRTIAEEVYQTLSERFDARPWGRTEVVLVDNDDRANGFATVIPYNLIVLRVVPPTADNVLADYDHWLKTLFMHEYTHVIHLSDTGYPAKLLKILFGKLVAPNGLSPGWVTEGMATYFETAKTTRGRGRSSYTDMLLRTDILRDKFLHLDQMAGTQYDWPTWMAQYLYGVGFWQYLSETYGEQAIVDFSHEYGSSLFFFALNHQSKKVFKVGKDKKSFYELWDDWKKSLEMKYAEVKEERTKEGLKEGESFLTPQPGESFSLPTVSPDGKKLAYQAVSVHHPNQLRLRDLESGQEKIVLKKKDVQQLSFSPDGEKLIVSYAAPYHWYYQYSDLHEINLQSSRATPLTQGKRMRDPDYAPDGKKIVAVRQTTDGARLSVYDVDQKEWREIVKEEQLDHPRWLPDGHTVVASVRKKQQRDLWLIDTETGQETQLTNDSALEDRPVVDAQGEAIYFSSDAGGIQNIWRYDLRNKENTKVTNLLTGAFSPAVSSGGEIYFQYYNGKGFEVRKIRGNVVAGAESFATAFSSNAGKRLLSSPPILEGLGEGAADAARISSPAATFPEKKYNPFKKLFIPRYVMPNLVILDNAIFASAMVSNLDPIARHRWFGDVTYRSDNQFFGFDVGYTYGRFRTPFSVGYSDFTVNYGNVFGFGTNFYEERRRAFGGVAFPFQNQRVVLNYFFENRLEHSGLPAGTTLSTLGHYAGLYGRYSVGKVEGTRAGISPEGGERFSANVEVTHKNLGASDTLEQQVFWGDSRAYLKIPWTDHHVLAFRAAGGAAYGDRLLQGNFGLGGSIGESPFAATSSRVFTLRGLPLVTFSRDRAWVASAEYRLPLFRVQRGLGTWPIALNSAHFAAFADVGDAFNRGGPYFRPLLGVGGELRGDFVIGYHIPVMGRLGYGVILTNRDRIAGATDALTGGDARNGVLVLEVGTSF